MVIAVKSEEPNFLVVDKLELVLAEGGDVVLRYEVGERKPAVDLDEDAECPVITQKNQADKISLVEVDFRAPIHIDIWLDDVLGKLFVILPAVKGM